MHRCVVKAVLFDMDGVITDSMRYHCRAWQQVLREHGVDVAEQEIYLREGQKGIDSVKEFFALHEKKFTQRQGLAILSEKEVLFKKITRPYFIRGARSMVRHLSRQGFMLALVTGTARHEAQNMLPRSLMDCFDVVVTGSDVNNGKPHPEPYLTAINKLKLKPSECVVVENAPFGIASAKAARIRCIALETSLPADHLKQADYIFSSYKDMLSQIEFISS